MIDSPNTDTLIHWLEKGDGFIITSVTSFCDKILPQYFDHKNYASFIRQLNMYDFYKKNRQSDNQGTDHVFNHP